MGDTWITDMRHFLEVEDTEVGVRGPARQLVEYFGRIVEAATSHPPMFLLNTEIRCRRRPGRRPCVGHIRLVCNEDEGEIVWECTSCDDRGIISGFEGTPWDRSLEQFPIEPEYHKPATFEPVDDQEFEKASSAEGTIEIVLDGAELSAVRSVSQDQAIPSKIIDNGRPDLGGFKIIATARNISAFHDYLFEIAISNRNPSYVQLLGQSIKKMAVAHEAFLDEIF